MPKALIIPFQPQLPQVLPTVEGNVDDRDGRDQRWRIDQLLISSGVETQRLPSDLEPWIGRRKKLSARAQQTRQTHCRRGLRCNLARHLLQEDYRGFAARSADSALLPYFCGLSEVDRVKVPSQSTLQR